MKASFTNVIVQVLSYQLKMTARYGLSQASLEPIFFSDNITIVYFNAGNVSLYIYIINPLVFTMPLIRNVLSLSCKLFNLLSLLKPGLKLPQRTDMDVIKHYLDLMQKSYSPLQKLQNLLKATSTIHHCVSQG